MPTSLTKYQCCILEQNVTFKGISNLTADSIFKLYSYKPTDIYVGYTFAKLGYTSTKSTRDEETEIKVDMSLIHDIVPQKGGGNEPLGTRKPDPTLIAFLSSISED